MPRLDDPLKMARHFRQTQGGIGFLGATRRFIPIDAWVIGVLNLCHIAPIPLPPSSSGLACRQKMFDISESYLD
jgi:hypothetical protein